VSSSDEQWRQLGNAIADNAHVLASLAAFDSDEQVFDELKRSFQFLLNHGFAEGHNNFGLWPTPLLMDISTALSRGEARRHQVPDIEDWLSRVRLDVGHYKGAFSHGEEKDASRFLQNIRNSVLRMRYELRHEVQSLQYFLQTEFGHVSSIRQKIDENQYFIGRTSQLADRLVFISRNELGRLAGENTILWRLFNRFLEDVQGYREDVAAIIPQLENMFWSFKKQDARTRLLWAIDRHIQNGDTYLTRGLDEDELLKSPFNLQVPEADLACVDVDSDSMKSSLIEIVKKLPPRSVIDKVSGNLPEVGVYDPDDAEVEIQPDKDQMSKHRRAYIEKAYGRRYSAKAYWEDAGDMDTSFDVWLIWIYGEVYSVPRLNMLLEKKETESIEGTIIVRDLSIEINQEGKAA